MKGYGKTMKAAGLLLLVLLALTLASCEQPGMKDGSLSLSIVDSKSILPSATRVTWVTIGGTLNANPTETKIDTQAFELGKPIAITGLSVGTWTFKVVGYNGNPANGGTVLTLPAVDKNVNIISGKTTMASFTLQYLTTGSGSADVTVTWPNSANLAVKGTLTSKTATVEKTVPLSTSGSSLLSYTSLVVDDYDLEVTMINPSGATIGFPMLEMVNIFSDLESIGTVALEAADLPSLGVPTISAGSETTSTGETVYAYRLVTLTGPKSGSKLYYTTDGTEPGFSAIGEPNTSTTEYTAPFELKATDSAVTSTVKAISSKDGYVDSQVATASYTVNGTGETGTVITPPALVSNVVLTQDSANPLQFSVGYDTQGTPKETLSWYVDTEATAAVDMDTDADGKTFTSDLLTEGRHQVMVKIAYTDGTEEKTAFASKRFDVSQTASPVLNLTGGIPQTVTLSSTTDGATMHYRYATGGDDPSGAYTEGTSFTVTSGTSLKVEAYATNYGLEASPVVTANYQPTAIPVFSPSSATFPDSQEVTMTSVTGATIYYTTDGTTAPTTSSSSIASGESITVSDTTTVKAMAVKSGMVNSATVEGTYKKLVYAIGDTGPAGGFIFYVNADHTYGDWTYLEAAPADEKGTHAWGIYNTLIGSAAEGAAIGTGNANTEAIVLKYVTAGGPYASKTDYAAKLCIDKTVINSGIAYDDWFLPSSDELNLLYTNLYKSNPKGFISSYYWSSSECSEGNAWLQNFSIGSRSYSNTGYAFCIRAVRSF